MKGENLLRWNHTSTRLLQELFIIVGSSGSCVVVNLRHFAHLWTAGPPPLCISSHLGDLALRSPIPILGARSSGVMR